MFGLTKREQRWKAEHQAAELVCDLVKEIVKAAKGQPGGECKSEDPRYQELIMAVSKKYPGETRHETALRYIRQAEEPKTNCCASREK